MYSVEEEGGVHFITMELVHGKTLADVLSRGALSPSRFFELAVPLADAVAAAHSEEDIVPVWSPDGQSIVFPSARGEARSVCGGHSERVERPSPLAKDRDTMGVSRRTARCFISRAGGRSVPKTFGPSHFKTAVNIPSPILKGAAVIWVGTSPPTASISTSHGAKIWATSG